jgi:hypothetical protein
MRQFASDFDSLQNRENQTQSADRKVVGFAPPGTNLNI